MGNNNSTLDITNPKKLKQQLHDLENNMFQINEKYLNTLEEQICGKIKEMEENNSFFSKLLNNLRNNQYLSYTLDGLQNAGFYLTGGLLGVLNLKKIIYPIGETADCEINHHNEWFIWRIDLIKKEAYDLKKSKNILDKEMKNVYEQIEYAKTKIKDDLQYTQNYVNNIKGITKVTNVWNELYSTTKQTLFTTIAITLSTTAIKTIMNTNSDYENKIKNLKQSLEIIDEYKNNLLKRTNKSFEIKTDSVKEQQNVPEFTLQNPISYYPQI